MLINNFVYNLTEIIIYKMIKKFMRTKNQIFHSNIIIQIPNHGVN